MGKSYRGDSKFEKNRKFTQKNKKKHQHRNDVGTTEKFDWKRIDTDQGN